MTIVLAPTTSLMLRGLRATYLGSAQRDACMETRVLEGKFEHVYCTPESFLNATGGLKSLFRALIAQRMVGFIAVDHAHLVRTWRSG